MIQMMPPFRIYEYLLDNSNITFPDSFETELELSLVHFQQHVKICPEQEVCGLLVSRRGFIRYLPCKNISNSPNTSFEINPNEFLSHKYIVLAVCHSHPTQEIPKPSKTDVDSQRLHKYPWVICGKSGELVWLYEK